MSTAWGSSYVNQFLDGGRVKRVFVQGDAPYRMRPEDFGRWHVRNSSGDTAPFSAFASGHWTHGPPKLDRYNGIPSIEILGQPAPGYSTGEAMEEIERLIAQLPPGVGHEWTGLSYEERLSGGQAPALYALSLLVVFLCLAALYESWSIPVSVLLIVPLGVIGAVLGAMLRGFDNGVYFQVALVTTVGLSAKNAILIVEFAKANVEQGMGLIEAAVHAAQQRLRPILMTSLAFMFGVLPLAISSGAGSGAQNAVGTGVVGGTLTATVLGIFFVPVFFVVVSSLLKPRRIGDRRAVDGGGALMHRRHAFRLCGSLGRWPSCSRSLRRSVAAVSRRSTRHHSRRCPPNGRKGAAYDTSTSPLRQCLTSTGVSSIATSACGPWSNRAC